MQASHVFKLAVICGGPSEERGISLNSARSVMDHLTSPFLEIIPLYVDFQKKFYHISTSQLYSNTPADFDFKLHETAVKLNDEEVKAILKSVDLVFPLIHGSFGEDGELQAQLEDYQVPFVGHSSASCRWMFHKYQASETLRGYGFATLPQLLLNEKQQDLHALHLIKEFFHTHKLNRAIVKPAIGGSSIGVYSVSSPEEAYARLQEIFFRKMNTQAILEPFCEGKEFTVVVLQNLKGEPIALVPTEVDLSYEENQIFDYRKKYLPTNQAAYHTPPKFSLQILQQIRMQAEQMFTFFGMQDFVRLDGWITKEGVLYFTDINPLSGLEQNSFLFRQASILGLTHRDVLEYVLQRACQRYGLAFPTPHKQQEKSSKLPVYVLFGNHNAERQVSLMTGTNVWLKLLQSGQHFPIPFLFDPEGAIWELPYSYTLNHTVEEIYANCLAPYEEKEDWKHLVDTIRFELNLTSKKLPSMPKKMFLQEFLERARQEEAFVFIAMHGGDGEDGTLQRELETYQIPFNGSNSQASALCMDKYLTGQAVQSLEDPDIQILPKKLVSLISLANSPYPVFEDLWAHLCRELGSERLIVKPRCDGCSAGIILLQSHQDLRHYCQFLFQKTSRIPANSFMNQSLPVEMPSLIGDYLFEPYIETDRIIIRDNQLYDIPKEGWLELTIGVLEQQGIYHALNPSITIAEGSILSLEEKFQGGTGVNLTPPPSNLLSDAATGKIKYLVEKVAQVLGIENYARLDIFFNRFSEKMIVIEANTLPALTPSTVIYHQGLSEEPPLTPLGLLEKIITSKLSLSRLKAESANLNFNPSFELFSLK